MLSAQLLGFRAELVAAVELVDEDAERGAAGREQDGLAAADGARRMGDGLAHRTDRGARFDAGLLQRRRHLRGGGALEQDDLLGAALHGLGPRAEDELLVGAAGD